MAMGQGVQEASGQPGNVGYTRLRSALELLAPPFVAFLLARAVVFLAAVSVSGSPASVALWMQGDPGLYVSIAEEGYTLFPCEAPYPPGTWCGNAGWLPGLPWLIRLSTRIVGSPRLAALLLAGLFQLAGLLMMWRGLLGGRLGVRTALALMLAALFPGAVYCQAGFPISQFLFFAILTLIFFACDRPAWGATWGAFAALSYSTGFVLTPVLWLWSILTHAGRRLVRTLVAALVVSAGFLVVLAVQEAAVGVWDAFFRVQAKYGHGLSRPFAVLGDRLEPLVRPELWRRIGAETIALRADNGEYVCAEGGGGGAVVANRPQLGPWETFAAVSQMDGRIALRAANGLYLSVSGDERRTVTASARLVGNSETFRLRDLGGDRVAIETVEGKYVAAEGGGGRELVGNRSRVGAWETLTRVRVKNDAPPRLVLAAQSLFVTVLLFGTASAVLWRNWARRQARGDVTLGGPGDPEQRTTLRSRLHGIWGHASGLGRCHEFGLDLLLLVYSVAFFLFPLAMGGAVTARRAESLLMPLAALTRRLPPTLQALAVGAAASLAFAVGQIYFVVGD